MYTVVCSSTLLHDVKLFFWEYVLLKLIKSSLLFGASAYNVERPKSVIFKTNLESTTQLEDFKDPCMCIGDEWM